MDNRRWERALIGAEKAAGNLADLLEISQFITDHSFVTRDGFVGVAVRLNPAPFECLDPIDQDVIARRWQAQQRQLDPECRVKQYFMKRAEPVIESKTPDDPVAAQVAADRLEFLHSRADKMYSVDVYASVVYEVKPIGRTEAQISKELLSYAFTLESSVEAMLSGLATVSGQMLGRDAFPFLRQLLNYDRALECVRLDGDVDLAWQLTGSNISVEGIPMMGLKHFRVFTMREPPKTTHANLMECLCKLSGNMILVSDWKLIPSSRVQARLQSAKQHFNNTKRPMRNRGADVGERDRLTHGGKQGLIDQVEEMERSIELEGALSGFFCFTVILYADDPMELRRLANEVHSALAVRNGQMVEQTGRSALAALLSIVPGNHRYSFRPQVLSDTNYADMSFLFGVYRGNLRNEFLQGEYLAVMETRWSTPAYVNLHVDELGHTMFTGIPRCGKTAVAGSLIAAAQKYQPNTIIYDTAGSYRKLTAHFGGSYVELGRRDGSAQIAPFCLEQTPRNVNFQFELVRMLMESDLGPPVSSEEIVTLHRAIERVYRLPRRTLGTLAMILPPDLGARLSRWVHKSHLNSTQSGQYAHLFDNETDTLSFSRFQTLNFPDLRKDRTAVDALLFYALHLTDEVVESATRHSVVLVDETFSFLQHQAMAAKLVQNMKAWPKRGGSLWMIVHSVSDIDLEVCRPLVEACASFVHGWNPRIDEGEWRKQFKLNASETDAIRLLRSPQLGSADPYAEFYLQGCGILQHRETPEALAMYGPGFRVKEAQAKDQGALVGGN